MTVEELELAWLTGRAVADEAFETFLRRHEKLVLRTAWRMLGALEDAQDAAQEVFLRAFRHFGDLAPNPAPERWLYRVTMNICYDALRKRRVTEEMPELATPALQLDAVDGERRRQLLLHALSRLPAKERAAVLLRDLEGLETREVAAILNSSETTVRSQISIARGKLRQWLQGTEA